jgi:mono/diheme cytochrome c family protein
LFFGEAFNSMRLILLVILMTPSIVAPLAAGPGEPADPQGRGVSPGSASQAPERPSSSFSPATIAQFRANCIDCHDLDGRGEGGREVVKGVPDFTDLRWQGSRADEDLRGSILEGKGRSMPAMRAKIKPDDASRLVSLVRGFGGGRLVIPDQSEENPTPSQPVRPPTDKVPSPKALPSREASASRKNPEAIRREAAKAAFRLSCRKCHGDDGKGDPLRAALPSIPDFTNRQWQQNTSKAQLTASILEGKSTHMPAFRSKLGNAQVDELVAYIRAFVPSQRESIGHQPEDFERRLAELQKEFDELRRVYRELSPPPRRD